MGNSWLVIFLTNLTPGVHRPLLRLLSSMLIHPFLDDAIMMVRPVLDHGLLTLSNILRYFAYPLRMFPHPTKVFQHTLNLCFFQNYSGFVKVQKGFLDAIPVQRVSSSVRLVAVPTQVFKRVDK